jgi:hypothetical protein
MLIVVLGVSGTTTNAPSDATNPPIVSTNAPTVATKAPSLATDAPTTPEPTTPSPSLGAARKCKWNYSKSENACEKLTQKCGQFGIEMKYVGKDKCIDVTTGKNVRDGGCQCLGYCGYVYMYIILNITLTQSQNRYVCEEHCSADPECAWDAAANTGLGACGSTSGETPGGIDGNYCVFNGNTVAPSQYPTNKPKKEKKTKTPTTIDEIKTKKPHKRG